MKPFNNEPERVQNEKSGQPKSDSKPDDQPVGCTGSTEPSKIKKRTIE